MKEWTFIPSFKDGFGGKVNDTNVCYGWYFKESSNIKYILCVTVIGIYVTQFENGIWKNTELKEKEIKLNF